jgi:hypothetical protein
VLLRCFNHWARSSFTLFRSQSFQNKFAKFFTTKCKLSNYSLRPKISVHIAPKTCPRKSVHIGFRPVNRVTLITADPLNKTSIYSLRPFARRARPPPLSAPTESMEPHPPPLSARHPVLLPRVPIDSIDARPSPPLGSAAASHCTARQRRRFPLHR